VLRSPFSLTGAHDIRVTSTPAAIRAAAILLDIEGTTTPVTFVMDVLFPYARRHLRRHLDENAGAVEYESLFARLRDEHLSALRTGERVPEWTDEPEAARITAAVAYAEWLMDRDRKTTALKELQGRIWESGYQHGELVGQVFPDVPLALQRWHEQGLSLGIFSSGSVLAQQLLFRHSDAGDLTGFLRWYFDTRVGPKIDADSYRRIATSVGIPAEGFLFLSDVPKELDAARLAGMQVRLVIRPGNAPISIDNPYQAIRSLEDISILNHSR
jgi:enolase-phosphatase E1